MHFTRRHWRPRSTPRVLRSRLTRCLPNIHMDPRCNVLQRDTIWSNSGIRSQPVWLNSGRLLPGLPIYWRWESARSLRAPYKWCTLHLGSLWDQLNGMWYCHIVETSLQDSRKWSWRYPILFLAYRLNSIEMLPKGRRLCRKRERLHFSGWRRKELFLQRRHRTMHWTYMHTYQFVPPKHRLATRCNPDLERRHVCWPARHNSGR